MSSNEQTTETKALGTADAQRPVDGLRSGPCFGREKELRELSSLAERSIADGVGRLVVVEGEAGIGKTRLGAALEAHLVAAGISVLSGRCRDGVHHAATYRPFVEILGEAIAALDDAGEAGIAERGREVRDVLAGRASAARQGADWAERRAALFDTVTGFLVDASRRLKLTIVVHDLDAADLATRELVGHVAASSIPAAPLATSAPLERLRGALIVTARSFDESLLSGTAATVVRLQPLNEEGVRAFLNTPEVVAFFAEATGGRPRALEALLESAPLDADDLLRARWERLGSAERQLVGALAVAGRPMSLVDLGALADLDGAALMLAAQELQATRLCRREVKRGEIVLSLYSRTDEETLYGLIPEPMLAPLHLSIGRWLASRGGDELLDRVRIAEHLLRGGAGAAAVEAAVHAVDALELTYGYDRAVDLLRRARVAALGLKLETDVSDNIVAGLDLRLCELERLVGDYDAALATALRIERRAPDAASSRRVAALHVLRDELDQALVALDTAAQLADGNAASDGATSNDEHARIAAARAEALYLSGRTSDAKAAAEAALAHVDDKIEARARALEVHNTLGKIALAEARYADATLIFNANINAARTMGNAFEEARALFNLGIAELRLGDHAQAQSRYQMALDIAESAGDHRNRAFCLQNLAVLALWRGEYAQALAQFQAAVSAFRRTGSRGRLAWVALDLASVYVDLNDVEGAKTAAALVAQLATRGMPLRIVTDRTLLDARIAMMTGDREGARLALWKVRELAAGTQPECSIEAGQLLVRLALDDGDVEGAQQELNALPQSKSDRTQIRTDLLRAELHIANRRGLEARRLLRDVLAIAQRIADAETEWRAQYFLGRAAQVVRDNAEAERRFGAAVLVDRRLRERVPAQQIAAFDNIPMRRSLAQAAGLAAVIALPVSPRPRPRLVDDVVVPTAPLLGRIIGNHARIRQVCSIVERVAPSESMVLIRGESGTGKELVAEALHQLSPRAGRPFVKVNCGAIVETLLLSELFGHERGAFTGAIQRKKGRFEVADGGTIFLDEIGDISPHTQVALLRVLQERQFERVGGTTPVHVDVRILCATHRNLEAMVARGEFREDLYYRLRGIQVELPALRERASDVHLIAQSLLAAAAAQRNQKPLQLTPDAVAMLTAHAWPGNVRELENVLRSAALFAENGHIGVSDLAEVLAARTESPVMALPSPELHPASHELPASADPAELAWLRLSSENLSLKELKVRVEVECIQRALALCKGNITRAAAKLGMKRPRLSQLVKEHGLRIDTFGDDLDLLTEENS